jgi:hypothetical protein
MAIYDVYAPNGVPQYLLFSGWQAFIFSGVITIEGRDEASIDDFYQAKDGTVKIRPLKEEGEGITWSDDYELWIDPSTYVPKTILDTDKAIIKCFDTLPDSVTKDILLILWATIKEDKYLARVTEAKLRKRYPV